MAGLVVFFSGALIAFMGPPYGLEAPEPIGPYLNGVFPATPPQSSQAPKAWKVQAAFPHLTFSNILAIEPVPHSNLMAVADRFGNIWLFENEPDVRTKQRAADLTDRVEVPRDGGLMGLAFHPHFGDPETPGRNYVYVSYNAAGNRMRLSRFSVRSDLTLDLDSELVMIEQGHGDGKTHFGGSLAFGTDGFLYVPIGDTENRLLEAQTITDNLVGGILRIDVDMNPGKSHAPRRRLPKTDPDEVSGRGYWIPNDNPFLDPDGSVFEEYYSIGHRNPWKIAVDRETGGVWVSEVGNLQRDEFNYLQAGGNYGWYMREGSVEAEHLDIAPPPPPASPLGVMQEPVFDDRFGVVSGGVVYRGDKLASLKGKFIGYAGGIVALELEAAGKKASPTTLVASNAVSLTWAFGADHAGELYFIEGGQNRVIKTLAPIVQTEANVPPLLSQTGAFVNLQTLEPAPGVIPYALNAPFWSDGALKSRWIAVPNDGAFDSPGETVVFDENEPWQYPPGTVAIKHFELQTDRRDPSKTRRLETRFLIRGEGDAFYGLTYRWRPDGADAELLAGEMLEQIPVVTSQGIEAQPWLYPGRETCLECHSQNAGVFLGPQTRQLNGFMYYEKSGVTANQLESWNHIGIFAESLDESTFPRMTTSTGIDRVSASLEHRARSYLDSNCGYCHRPGGVPTLHFDARLSEPLERAGIIDGFAFNNLGDANNVILAPGDTARSLIYLRMKSLEEQVAMPELAKAKVDTAGLKLIADWILSLGVRVTSFAPERALPGAEVVLTGTRFDEATGVTFNGTPASFSIDSATQITAIVPDSASSGPIAVATSSGTAASAADFEVLDTSRTHRESSATAHEHHALLSAYPNPSIRSFYVNYSLAHTDHVHIELFDARGGQIATLTNEVQPAGAHQLHVDGSSLAGGVYYLRFSAGETSATQTITKIR